MQPLASFFKFLAWLILGFFPLAAAAQSAEKSPSAPASAKAYTLTDCYDLTLEKSEALKIRDEQLKLAEVQYKEALAGIYPQLTYEINHTIRDNANFGRVNRGRGTSVDDPSTPVGGSGGILGKTQTAGTVSLTQPIFTGFREYLLSDAAEMEADRIRLQNIRAKELLFRDVAELFYQIIYTEREIAVVEQAKKTLRARIAELNEFIELGKSRESEVLASKSEIAELDTAKEQLKGLVAASKELLAFLTGVEASLLKLKDQPEVKIFDTVDRYLEIAKERSDIKASRILVEAESKRLEAAKRARWPQVGLSANAYTFDDPDRNREWEVFLNLSLPLFDGGQITARTEAVEARLRSAALQAKEILRLSERDIRVAYANVASSREQIESLKKLRSAARSNYELQKKDYQNGVVTNLEVLQALQQLQESERRLLQAESQYRLNIVALKVSAGGFVL